MAGLGFASAPHQVGIMDNGLAYFLGIPVVIWSLPVLVIAAIYAVFWPKKLVETRTFSPWTLRILRWGNSVSWLCLALALIAWGLREIPLAILMVILGGVAYLLFIVVVSGRGRRGDF
jgi:hypothetical protein